MAKEGGFASVINGATMAEAKAAKGHLKLSQE
jgi:hypothetical protein